MSLSKKLITTTELVVLFIGFPILYLFDFLPGLWKLVPLIILFVYCVNILFKAKTINRDDFRLEKIKMKDWIKFLVFPPLLFILLFFIYPDNVFADFSNPRVVLAVIAYPVFSSLPQEIIFRKFFYFRYAHLIKNERLLILINAVLFSFAHIFFMNYVALILTLLGGFVFSRTYLKSKSLILVTIEHSIYGLALLCSSLYPYFYKEF